MRFLFLSFLLVFPLVLKSEVLLQQKKAITGKWQKTFSFEDRNACPEQPVFLKISGKMTGKK